MTNDERKSAQAHRQLALMGQLIVCLHMGILSMRIYPVLRVILWIVSQAAETWHKRSPETHQFCDGFVIRDIILVSVLCELCQDFTTCIITMYDMILTSDSSSNKMIKRRFK